MTDETPTPAAPSWHQALRSSRLTLFLVVVAVLVGVVLRLDQLTKIGLFQDDAWVALSGRVSFSTAMKMSGTAPGFFAVLHPYWSLHPQNPWWAQLPALCLGVLGLCCSWPFFYRFTTSARWATAGTALVAIAPVPVATSGHVKPYTLDFVNAMVLLVLAHAVLERRGRHGWWWLAAASIVTFWLSASIVVVVLGVWLVVVGNGVRSASDRRGVLGAAGLTAVCMGATFAACYANLPTALVGYWRALGNFLELHGLRHEVSSIFHGFTQGLFPTDTSIPHEVLLVGLGLAALALLGAAQFSTTSLASASVAVAVIAAAASKIPIGTGRTDEVLYPAIFLLVVTGAKGVAEHVRTRASVKMARVLCGALMGLLAVGALTAVVHPKPYPAVGARQLALQIGTRSPTVVDPYARYPWALSVSRSFRLLFNPGFGAGFTVADLSPTTQIAPAQAYEVGYNPARWARLVACDGVGSSAPASSFWYVQSPPDGVANHDAFTEALATYAITPSATSRRAPGIVATLFTRTSPTTCTAHP